MKIKIKKLNLISKLDKFLFKNFSKLVINWVVKKKYQKTKYDFLLKAQKLKMTLLAGIIVIFPFTFTDKLLSNIPILIFFIFFHTSIWCFIFYADYNRFLKDKKRAEIYFEIFSQRKNPEIYNFIKDITRITHEEQILLRKPFILVWLALAFIVLLFIIPTFFTLFNTIELLDRLVAIIFLITLIFIGLLDIYIDGIFDFDPPDKKYKKEKEKLTTLVEKRIKDMIDSIAKKPNFNPI